MKSNDGNNKGMNVTISKTKSLQAANNRHSRIKTIQADSVRIRNKPVTLPKLKFLGEK